jgi:hypothetical protein
VRRISGGILGLVNLGKRGSMKTHLLFNVDLRSAMCATAIGLLTPRQFVLNMRRDPEPPIGMRDPEPPIGK